MDKEIEVLQEAYEKILLNESNIDDVADIFTRFLVGDRKVAMKQLQRIHASPIEGIDGEKGIIGKVLNQRTGDMSEYNKMYSKLRANFAKAIKSA